MEWIIVGLVVVVLFFGGAKKIPDFAKSLGRARGEYERGRIEVEKQIAKERASLNAAPATDAPPAAGEPEPAKRFCGKCGAEAAAEAGFCAKCGTTLETPT
jgi:sec-independent protein translocase protein TatA